jgi:hypothetical protein
VNIISQNSAWVSFGAAIFYLIVFIASTIYINKKRTVIGNVDKRSRLDAYGTVNINNDGIISFI